MKVNLLFLCSLGLISSPAFADTRIPIENISNSCYCTVEFPQSPFSAKCVSADASRVVAVFNDSHRMDTTALLPSQEYNAPLLKSGTLDVLMIGMPGPYGIQTGGFALHVASWEPKYYAVTLYTHYTNGNDKYYKDSLFLIGEAQKEQQCPWS